MKRALIIFLAILTFIMPLNAYANDSSVKVIVDGNEVVFDQQPVIMEGRTLVPLRAIFEALGANVKWNSDTSTVVANKGTITITLQIGSNRVYKVTPSFSDYFEIDVPAIILNSRTLVPVRAISEALDALVLWNGDTREVTIESKNKEIKDNYLTDSNQENSTLYYDILVNYPYINGYDAVNKKIEEIYTNKFNEVKEIKQKESKTDYDGSVLYGWTFITHKYELVTEVKSVENGKITITSYETNYNGNIAPLNNEITYVFDAHTGELVK